MPRASSIMERKTPIRTMIEPVEVASSRKCSLMGSTEVLRRKRTLAPILTSTEPQPRELNTASDTIESCFSWWVFLERLLHANPNQILSNARESSLTGRRARRRACSSGYNILDGWKALLLMRWIPLASIVVLFGGVDAFRYTFSSLPYPLYATSIATRQRCRHDSLWNTPYGTAMLCRSSAKRTLLLATIDDKPLDDDADKQKNTRKKPKNRSSRFSKDDASSDVSTTLPENTVASNEHDSNVNGLDVLNGSKYNQTLIHRVPSPTELQLLQRVMQLEQLVAAQQVQLRRMSEQVKDMTQSTTAFAELIALFREAGLQQKLQAASEASSNTTSTPPPPRPPTSLTKVVTQETVDDAARSMFGTAPASVMDAADAAGASILAGVLGGKQRMLVDVRDAELSFDPQSSLETLVQFIELAILPVAAGLEGLRSRRNRLKVVFPTVSQLLLYRRNMALAAPEVVALSTLGFDPVEQKDNLVVILVPSPGDEEGLKAMNELLESNLITQPVVVLNHHMVPVTGPAASFEVAYHLRLLSVQYMTDPSAAADGAFEPEQLFGSMDATTTAMEQWENATTREQSIVDVDQEKDSPVEDAGSMVDQKDDLIPRNVEVSEFANDSDEGESIESSTVEKAVTDELGERDEALEAALKHAQQLGVNHGTTRAMVIRAYPQPWHVFVDTSPDTDADYEVAATFADEPDINEVNIAIMECLEGSELEDELVAQQMQQALELGQLDRISEMLSSMGLDDLDVDDDDEDDDEDPYKEMFGEDTV